MVYVSLAIARISKLLTGYYTFFSVINFGHRIAQNNKFWNDKYQDMIIFLKIQLKVPHISSQGNRLGQ